MFFRYYVSTGLWLVAIFVTASSSFANTLADIETITNKEAILYLQTIGIISGYDNGTFKPNATVNRAELLKMLVAAIGKNPTVEEFHDCFPDVSEQWFAPYVCYTFKQGWVKGYPDGLFRPAQTINMVEAIKMILMAANTEPMQSSTAPSFSDVKPDAWYAPYVMLAKQRGLLGWVDGNVLGVSKRMTRGEVSEILYRALNGGIFSGTPDKTENSSWDVFRASMRRGGGGSGQPAADTAASSSQVGTIVPTISFETFYKNYSETDAFVPTITSNSNGSYTFVSGDESIIVSNGSTLQVADGISEGSVVITVTQAAAGIYTSGSATGTIILGLGVDQCTLFAPCNGGTCTPAQTTPPGFYDTYVCSDCPEPFEGPTCQDQSNGCVNPDTELVCSGPSQGTCDPDPSGGTCECAPCYTGDYCELDDLACA